MAEYDLHIYCESCNQTHPKGIKVTIDGGPLRKISVGAFYAGRQFPRKLESFLGSGAVCPNTGKLFKQSDIYKIFLIPIDDTE